MPYQYGPRTNVFPSVAEMYEFGQRAKEDRLRNAILREQVAGIPERREGVRLENLLRREQVEGSKLQRQATEQQMGTRELTDRLQRWKTGLALLGTVKNKKSYTHTLQLLERMYPETFEQDFGDLPFANLIDDFEEFGNEMRSFHAELSGEKEEELKDRKITTWRTRQGDIVNLPDNVLPPKGSVKYSDWLKERKERMKGKPSSKDAEPKQIDVDRFQKYFRDEVHNKKLDSVQKNMADEMAGAAKKKINWERVGDKWRAIGIAGEDKLEGFLSGAPPESKPARQVTPRGTLKNKDDPWGIL